MISCNIFAWYLLVWGERWEPWQKGGRPVGDWGVGQDLQGGVVGGRIPKSNFFKILKINFSVELYTVRFIVMRHYYSLMWTTIFLLVFYLFATIFIFSAVVILIYLKRHWGRKLTWSPVIIRYLFFKKIGNIILKIEF